MSLESGMSFLTKDIAKAFFELDIPSNRPSVTRKVPTPHNRNRPVISPSSATKGAKGNKLTLLTLPTEIRLQIYGELLVGRYHWIHDASWAVETTDHKKVLLHMIQALQYDTMEPDILRTCKQIYHEANSRLYSQNVFSFIEPERMLGLIAQIGWENLKLVKSIDFWVPFSAELSSWLQLLHILAENSSGLRRIDLGWGAVLQEGFQSERGLGDNLDFVRALGKIQGLEKLVIRGYYAKNWPAYLNAKMGGRVEAICGLPYRNGPFEGDEECVREQNEDNHSIIGSIWLGSHLEAE